jgi:phosphoglycolate phosphatase-like HAD superfamily hydrolase
MVQSIIGDHAPEPAILHKIQNRVAEFIELSAGIQTIFQMEMLVDLVREFKMVPEREILDKSRYKSIYLKQLLEVVNERVKGVKNDPLKREAFMIKGAFDFLRKLKEHNIKLYLASGTDLKDVIHEAGLMGYADLFEGRIYGAVEDIHSFSKRKVIKSIIRENQLKENDFMVIGDGPVEIREGKKNGGIAIGVASDEKQGSGIDLKKRSRLIKAGADLIISDYLESEAILKLLFN